jgi:hypothetical protein
MNYKKETWNLKTIIMILMLCVGFVSCSKDEAKEGGNNSSLSPLVGTWERTEMSAGDRVTTTLIFNADGTYSETARVDSKVTLSESGKYSYNETKGVLVTAPTSGRSWTYFVAEVSDITLVLVFSDYSGSITYTRK